MTEVGEGRVVILMKKISLVLFILMGFVSAPFLSNAEAILFNS